ncbi:hypothetical protein LEP1GSC170_0473, partial [Leptospira interrogans serovar Bataviae str. HAI135]
NLLKVVVPTILKLIHRIRICRNSYILSGQIECYDSSLFKNPLKISSKN